MHPGDFSMRYLGLLLVTGAFLPTCHLQAQEHPKPGDIILEPTSLTSPEGKVEFELGTLYVPENRAEAKSRIIGVGFARFKALEQTGTPPMFSLPGGPGGSYLLDLKQGSPRLAGSLKTVAELRRFGDVVFVDQRGYSERGEILKFKHRTPDQPLDQPASITRSTAAFADFARAAVADLTGRGIDLRGYTVKECADDVNDLRKALGYEQICLVGGSFGSQWSFAVMRRHPDIVARALLAGVEPLDYGYDMPSHVLAAVQRMWWEAEKDPRLQPYLPPGGLMGAAREVLRRLERNPAKVMLKTVKDASGEPATITLGHEDFQRDAFGRGAAGPAFVLAIYYERYDPWAAEVWLRRRGRQVEQPLLGPLIDTSLGVTPRRQYLLRTDPATEFLGHWNFDSYMATADVWPSPDVGDDFRTEVVSRTPVVLIHGDWDTQTPLENTLNIAPYFPNSHVLIVERGGHGAMNQIGQHLPDVREALTAFLKTGKTADLPARVTVPPPNFPLPSFDPPQR
jgi:pimeloyl-ACP methyl ester carboxylesterase